MKVEIIVARNGLPKIGEVRDYEKSYALDLIEKGLAKKLVDTKLKTRKEKADSKESEDK